MFKSLSAASLAALLLAPPAAAAPPDFNGQWRLNREASDDVAARIKEAAGSQYVSSAKGFGSFTILPWTSFSEGQRVLLRDALLAGVPAFEQLEIEQKGDEVRTVHGEDGVRNFNLKRASTGTALATGEKVKREARWQGEQLVLESSSGKLRTLEVLTRYAERDQVIEVFRIEMDLLEKPIELKLVYDRARPAP